MQATSTGSNLTGSAVSPEGCEAMLEAVREFNVPGPLDTSAQEEQRLIYIEESDSVGSVPPPTSVIDIAKATLDKLVQDTDPVILMDKIGERIAFERGGTRLYDALITKYKGVSLQQTEVLPSVTEMVGFAAETSNEFEMLSLTLVDETPLETLTRIRSEELAHFKMLCDAMEQLGGDPTAQTPCADAAATASMGLMQVVTDPRTTLAQSLNAMVAAELIDNAGWELLAEIAGGAGKSDLQDKFLVAMDEEQQHLATVKAWLSTLVCDRSGSVAV